MGLKHAARVTKRAGGGGVIVNMSSVLGVVGFGAAPAYTAAKHGLLGLTKAAAIDLAPANIRVVAVSPAFIRTYLVSDEAAFLTGATYLVDGGYTAP